MASLTFRVDEKLRQRFDGLVDQLGLNRSRVLREAISAKLAELEAMVAEQPRNNRRLRARTIPSPEEAVLQQVRGISAIEKAILFGSRALGDATPRSDVDIALSCPDITPKQWLGIAEAVQEAETLVDVDVVWLEEAPPSLRDEISKTGRVVYERS
jgi:predicted nucleotidyltransferase/predicted DNA-binding protein